MISRGVIVNDDQFDRAQSLTTTPGFNGWTIKDTSAAGTPTYLTLTEDGGAMKLLLDNTSEAQIVTMYQNDVLMLDLASLQEVEFIAKVSGIDAVTTLVFGLASAQNDTEDSVTVNCWFRIAGATSTSNIVVETDDNTTDNNNIATGTTLSSTYKTFKIDFTNGLGDVRFFVDGARVAAGTLFNMSAVTAGQNVQPFVQLHKASGTGIPSITIARIRTQQRYAYGS